MDSWGITCDGIGRSGTWPVCMFYVGVEGRSGVCGANGDRNSRDTCRPRTGRRGVGGATSGGRTYLSSAPSFPTTGSGSRSKRLQNLTTPRDYLSVFSVLLPPILYRRIPSTGVSLLGGGVEVPRPSWSDGPHPCLLSSPSSLRPRARHMGESRRTLGAVLRGGMKRIDRLLCTVY